MKIFNSLQIAEIAQEILNRKCVVVQTDTVMGIVGLDFVKISQIKKRDLLKKQVTFVNNFNFMTISKNFFLKKLIFHFWPGALTVISDGVSYRMPNSQFLLNLSSLTGNLYSSSANVTNHEPVTNAQECEQMFAENLDEIVFVEDENVVFSNVPSTIIDVDQKKLLRSGELINNVSFKKILRKWNVNID